MREHLFDKEFMKKNEKILYTFNAFMDRSNNPVPLFYPTEAEQENPKMASAKAFRKKLSSFLDNSTNNAKFNNKCRGFSSPIDQETGKLKLLTETRTTSQTVIAYNFVQAIEHWTFFAQRCFPERLQDQRVCLDFDQSSPAKPPMQESLMKIISSRPKNDGKMEEDGDGEEEEDDEDMMVVPNPNFDEDDLVADTTDVADIGSAVEQEQKVEEKQQVKQNQQMDKLSEWRMNDVFDGLTVIAAPVHFKLQRDDSFTEIAFVKTLESETGSFLRQLYDNRFSEETITTCPRVTFMAYFADIFNGDSREAVDSGLDKLVNHVISLSKMFYSGIVNKVADFPSRINAPAVCFSFLFNVCHLRLKGV